MKQKRNLIIAAVLLLLLTVLGFYILQSSTEYRMMSMSQILESRLESELGTGAVDWAVVVRPSILSFNPADWDFIVKFRGIEDMQTYQYRPSEDSAGWIESTAPRCASRTFVVG